MNNADKPAHPTYRTFDDSNVGESGLTKREVMAMSAMQGLLAGRYGGINNNIGLPDLTLISEQSVSYADALLKALETTKP